MIDYKLVELCMFGNSKSSISFDTNNIGSRDNNSFSLHFDGKKKIVATCDTECKDVRGFKSYYIIEKKIPSFWMHVNLSSSCVEEEVKF